VQTRMGRADRSRRRRAWVPAEAPSDPPGLELAAVWVVCQPCPPLPGWRHTQHVSSRACPKPGHQPGRYAAWPTGVTLECRGLRGSMAALAA
jgi:hypothetical protein